MGWGRLNLRATLEEFLSITAAPVVAGAPAPELEVSPNPTSNGVSLRFALPATSWVNVTVFDVAGRRVRVLLDGPRSAGPQDLRWNGADADGAPAAPGVYFARLESSAGSVLCKVTLLH
jgi:hypothetical protein